MNSNILFCSVGRRAELIKLFCEEFKYSGKVVAVDNSNIAPAIYFADMQYIVPPIIDKLYIDTLIDLCQKEKIRGITTLIDPEISLLSQNISRFQENEILVLHPSSEVTDICFDKYRMFRFLIEHGYNTIKTYDSVHTLMVAIESGIISFPLFIKPRTGSGSVGIQKINNQKELELFSLSANNDYIFQEFMEGEEYDADIYVDMESKCLVSVFTKKKLSSRIGGADKTVSCKDPILFELIDDFVKKLGLVGPADIDFFKINGKYYISEVNPRFGGAYLHAYASGVNFPKLVKNNLLGKINCREIGNYEEGLYMMMYDNIIFRKEIELCVQ
jgi:carbamoyl-phosphate synthase large subunit